MRFTHRRNWHRELCSNATQSQLGSQSHSPYDESLGSRAGPSDFRPISSHLSGPCLRCSYPCSNIPGSRMLLDPCKLLSCQDPHNLHTGSTTCSPENLPTV